MSEAAAASTASEPQAPNHAQSLSLRRLPGLSDYESTWQDMSRYTDERSDDSQDQLWLLEHPPVFTLGQAARREHVLDAGDIPLIQVDRGGQVTYHGPGQLVAYPLLDIRRLGLGVRDLVWLVEAAIIDTLASYGLTAARLEGAPGVYVGKAKIASLGLRVRHGRTFHGLAFNVDMDLEPFSRINPCGFAGMPITDLKREGVQTDVDAVANTLSEALAKRLNYQHCSHSKPE